MTLRVLGIANSGIANISCTSKKYCKIIIAYSVFRVQHIGIINVKVKGISIAFDRKSDKMYREAQSIEYDDNTGDIYELRYGHPGWHTEGVGNPDIKWSIVSGPGYMKDCDLYITQPGSVTVRGDIERNGYTASAEYTVNLTLGWSAHTRGGSDPEFLTSPTGAAIGTVPTGTHLEFTETQAAFKDGVTKLFGKTSYNGNTGWVAIGEF